MCRVLITSGPTRQYLDPVRYLTNASSGRMGAALAAAALQAGHQPVVVTGPVDIAYPDAAEVIPVVSTEEMLEACLAAFPRCDGLIGAAAPCDYRPRKIQPQKINKTGQPLTLQLVETPDVVAACAEIKKSQWMVAFALETEDPRMRALQKLERKNCDLVVLNGPHTIHSTHTQLEIINREGRTLATASGTKEEAARRLFQVIEEHLIQAGSTESQSSKRRICPPRKPGPSAVNR